MALTQGEETLRAIRREAADARDALERIELQIERLREKP